MRRVFSSSVRGVAAVAVILALAGSAVAGPREVKDKGRDRGQEQSILKMIRTIVRGLGDGLIVPIPSPKP